MLTYNLNEKTDLPLYVMLYQFIKEDIESGKIKPKEKLPSKRELAEHLGISVITVQNAHAQLIAEGYIYAAERKGYFACEIKNMPKKTLASPKQQGFLQQEATKNTGVISLCENAIKSKKFPFSIWSRQMRQVISENYDNILDSVPNMGLWSLRQAISDYLYRFRGMVVDPNLILIGAGAEYLYGLIIRLLGRDKSYGVENPGYTKISQIYAAEGIKMNHLPLDPEGLSSIALNQANLNVVYTSPAHNFPTGIVMPIKRRREILQWAHSAADRYIIEDDYDSEFRFAGKPLPTLQSCDPLGKTIYMNTFSKTIAPSLRISYMILPADLAKKNSELLGFYSCPVCSFEQHILAKFIAAGDFERHINRMRRYYSQHRGDILALIKKSPLGSLAVIKEEMSGLHFILKLKTNKSDARLKALAKAEGLQIAFLSDYWVGRENLTTGELIVNYSGIELADMQKAIEILAMII